MNYFEKHIGDYIRDTVSLTMLEDGAYNRLIDQYYQAERPLPADKKEVYRLARASSAAERKAVDYVLQRYFQLTDDGYRHKRCDEIIEAYWERDQGAETKRENDRMRQQRARERRQQLFDALRSHGIVPAFNTPTKQLQAELDRVKPQGDNGDVTPPVTPPVTRDNTATQTPDTNTQTPKNNKAARSAPPFVLPDWIPVEVWDEFIAMRKKKKAVNSDYALKLVIEELLKLQAAGDDPIACLNQSIANSWVDVYPLKDKSKRVAPGQQQQPVKEWWETRAGIIEEGRKRDVVWGEGRYDPSDKERWNRPGLEEHDCFLAFRTHVFILVGRGPWMKEYESSDVLTRYMDRMRDHLETVA